MSEGRQDRESGFTLLEVLVSLAIVGSVLPFIMLSFTNSGRNRAAADNRATAAFLLRDKLSELEALGTPELGQTQGAFEEGSRFEWQATVSQTQTDELYDVVVTVTWLESGAPKQLAVRTYMANAQLGEGGGATLQAPGGG